MKKFFALLLAAVMSISMPVWVFAQNGYQAQDDMSPLHPVSIEGYIENETETTIEVVSQDDNRIILNITPQTYIVDSVSGSPLALSDINGSRIIAYYGPVMGLSEPPVSTAVLIISNVSDDIIPPQFGQVEAISTTDDEVIVTVRGGSKLVTIERGSQIDPFLTRNIVTIDDIQVGSYLLMWYPLVTASYPGQATAQRTIILNRAAPAVETEYNDYADNGDYENEYNGYENDYNGYNDYNQTYEPIVDYYEQPYEYTQPSALSLADALGQVYTHFFTENNATMVPLRHVAEALGFTVIWNESNRSITLHRANGQASPSTIVVGQAYFEGYALQAAPTIRNDRTFVPVSLFEILLGQ